MRWYAVATPGLEPITRDELGTGEVLPGGVRFSAEIGDALSRLRMLRTPSRLLAELGEGPARSLEELDMVVRRVAWKQWLHPAAQVEVHATLAKSRLRFRESVEKRVAHVVREALKGPRVVDRGARPTMPQRVQVRVLEDRATVSLDAGGELLHVRGWRAEQGPAPIRENLAAAMVLASGWTGEEPLYDPFCGSGTIAIEAALLAAGRSPYGRRRFAYEEWPCAPKVRVAEGRGVAPVYASDRDARVLGAAEANTRRAGVEVTLRRCDVADAEPPAATGIVVTNPPYGLRLGEGNVWRAFGEVWRARFAGWRAYFLAPEPAQAMQVHRSARRLLHFSNGGVRVGLYVVG
ncbi:MAG: THUMP domain-containing class I SAM-dependent RNA methyltransferase [Myxococcota bacterium]